MISKFMISLFLAQLQQLKVLDYHTWGIGLRGNWGKGGGCLVRGARTRKVVDNGRI